MKGWLQKFTPLGLINCFWHKPKAILTSFIFHHPAKNLINIGVLGTKGKTTTAYLMAEILNQAGLKTALISTAALKIGDKEQMNPYKMTTPSPQPLNLFIKKAKENGCQALVLEISSHAIKQSRVWGIPFKILVVTNLVPDHLEYHKNSKDYLKTHLNFLKKNKKAVIVFNQDDKCSEEIKNQFPKALPFSLNSHLREKLKTIKTQLLGDFNISNMLAAITAIQALNINFSVIKQVLENIRTIPGRMEFIENKLGYQIIVDYAHSPFSLIKVFQAIQSLKRGKIITVFGACGERDRNQRPMMGKILDQYSDYIIVTNDDPYSEDSEQIAQDLIKGIYSQDKVIKILDRKTAIQKALQIAQINDWVLILGKGAEQWQIFKDKKIPWDDRQIVKQILIDFQK